MMTSLHASFPKKPTRADYNSNRVRHLILNMIRSANYKFRDPYGRIVICADSTKSWRKQAFPFYKAHRKTDRQKLEHIDWPATFALFDDVKQELRDFTRYPVIEVSGAEGDDLIGALAIQYDNEPNIIISRDRDFTQLQGYTGVKQYDPVDNRMISVPDPVYFLEEHIICGDRNDGVPNILSDDDTFVSDTKRQGKMTPQRLQGFMSTSVAEWPNEIHKRNWKRNQMMIDLRSAPTSIHDEAIEQFEAQKGKTNHKMFDYLVKNRLSELLDVVDHF